jgi:hypothetical protein
MSSAKLPHTLPLLVLSGLCLVAFGCGGSSRSNLSPPASTQPSAGTVSISPKQAALQAGSSLQFTALGADTGSANVEWLANGVAGGNSASGTISISGLYTAPPTVKSNTLVAVTVTSKNDPTQSGSTALTVMPGPGPITVSVSPSSASLYPNQAQQFAAAVTGTTNRGVRWFVNGNEGGDSSVGTISPTGLYTAPATPPNLSSVTITAESAYATGSSAAAVVTIKHISPDPAPTISAVSPNSGPMSGGTVVTISGSNFRSGAILQFGTLPALAVQVVDYSHIQALTPAQPSGNVSIRVQNSDGQIAIAAAAFTFTAPISTGGPLRDWRYWPFSQTSPWNQPIGSSASYVFVPGLSSLVAGLNYNAVWTSSIVIASNTDPSAAILFDPPTGPNSVRKFLTNGGKTCGNTPAQDSQLKSASSSTLPFPANYYSTLSTPNTNLWVLPANYQPASLNYQSAAYLPAGACPSQDTDAEMAVFQPNGLVLDSYATVVTSDGVIVTSMASYVDAKGDGTGASNGRRASMVPSFAGLIRDGEISAGHIPHALAAMAPRTILQTSAVWPAAAFDRSSNYTGTLPMGSLLAIPATIDLTTLGLSPQGLTIAHAAQDYGVYVVDSGGGGFTFLAELGDPEIRWDGTATTPPWWRDVQIILNNLQRVANNTASTPGGGGIPRAPLAPGFKN